MAKKQHTDSEVEDLAKSIYDNFLASTPGAMQRAVRAQTPNHVTPQDSEVEQSRKAFREVARAAKLAAEEFFQEFRGE